MNQKKKQMSRMLRLVREVLRDAFPFRFKRRGKTVLKSPEKPHLYGPQKPYTKENPPPDEARATARIGRNQQRRKDWEARGLGETFARVADELAKGTYARRARTYRGRVETVMAAAIREVEFLERWLDHERRRLSWLRERSVKRSHRRPERPPKGSRHPTGQTRPSHRNNWSGPSRPPSQRSSRH